MNLKTWAPIAAVAAALSMLFGFSLISKGGGTASPPIIRLAASTGASADPGTPAETGTPAKAGGSAAGRPSPVVGQAARGSYRLKGTLPEGPLEARVQDLPAGAVPVALVQRLVTALGETAEPRRAGSAWRAGDLVVTDDPGNQWKWRLGCASDTVAASGSGATRYVEPRSCLDEADLGRSGNTESSSSGSAVPGSPGTSETPIPDIGVTSPPRPLPRAEVQLTDSQALAATATIRQALSLDGAPTRVEGRRVVVEPIAGGLPTSGMATQLQLSSKARLVSATGWLSIGRDGNVYPLRPAREAFDDIPVLEIGAPCEVSGCPEGPVITGARLGLSRTALDKGAAALVPAWFFTVQNSPIPLVAIAVADQFLGSPAAAATDPGTKSSTEPGAIPSTEPGTNPSTEPRPAPRTTEPGVEPTITATTEPDPVGPVAPPPATIGTPAAPPNRQGFGFDGAYADADPKVLVIRYGDSGSCPSEAVRHSVVQAPGRVVVTLTRTPLWGRQCTADYRGKLLRVALTAPLDSREVVDGFRKEPVPISPGPPPR